MRQALPFELKMKENCNLIRTKNLEGVDNKQFGNTDQMARTWQFFPVHPQKTNNSCEECESVPSKRSFLFTGYECLAQGRYATHIC